MLMLCLPKVLGFGLPEEDSAVFASVLITPRMKKHRDVFRQFSSDGDWFYSIVCLHILILFTMTVLILPTLSTGTKDNGSGVYKHVCKSPYWWDLHWGDQKTQTLPTGKKISTIAVLSWFGNRVSWLITSIRLLFFYASASGKSSLGPRPLGNKWRLPLIQKTGGIDIMAGLELTRLNEPLFLSRDLEGAMERASR